MVANPEVWPPLDPEIEARICEMMARMKFEQKVGQANPGDSVTSEGVRQYRLGSVLSIGNSLGGEPYAAPTCCHASIGHHGWRAHINSMACRCLRRHVLCERSTL